VLGALGYGAVGILPRRRADRLIRRAPSAARPDAKRVSLARLSLGIEVQNDGLGPEVRQFHGVAALVGQRKVGGGIAGFERHGSAI
jgi:hypothetical protein